MIFITLTIPIIIIIIITSMRTKPPTEKKYAVKKNDDSDNGNNRDSIKESGWQVNKTTWIRDKRYWNYTWIKLALDQCWSEIRTWN